MDGRQVLRDPVQDARLRADACVVVSFLADAQVRHLLAAYDRLVPPGESGVQLDFVREDRRLVAELNDAMLEVLDPAFEAAFVDHWPVLPSFIVKYPGPETDFYLHRDIPVNDPRTNRCFTVWIPLVDVGADKDNGGLAIIPGSEQLATGEHGFDASVLIEPFTSTLRPLTQPVTARAGDALVYDGRLLHASPPNRSPRPRPAIGCLVGRRSEPLVHVVPTGRRGRVLYGIGREFFVDHHPADIAQHGMPEGFQPIATYEDHETVSADDVRRTLALEQPPVTTTSIPEDLLRHDDADRDVLSATPLPVASARLSTPDHDLSIAPDDLAPIGASIVGARVVGLEGPCGRRDLVLGGRRVDDPPSGLPRLASLLRRPATRDLALVSLGRDARFVLAAGPGLRGHLELVVLDAPQVRAGVRTDHASLALEPGRRIAVGDDGLVAMWNDGPGDAVVLLRRAIGAAPPLIDDTRGRSWDAYDC